MVIKCDVCYFTEMKIYPGHGKRIVRKDGKLLAFLNRKAWCMYDQSIKNQRLTWTQAWRRAHKKGMAETSARKRTKRTVTAYKAITGLSMDELRKRRTQGTDVRKAQREATLRVVKERKKVTKEAKKKAAASHSKAAPQKAFNKNVKGAGRR